MRLAHLILTHANPAQLSRLIDKLNHEGADFYVHLDLKTSVEPFASLSERKNVRFITKREKVHWAGYSLVEATVNGMWEILSTGIDYSYINLLSGQDYPIKSTGYIHQFLSANPGRAFMHSLSVREEWTEAIPRIAEYHLVNMNFPGRYAVQGLLNKLLPERKFPFSMTPVGRSQWFTIAPECAKYIIKFLEEHPSFVRFFKLSWAPDEMIFQTILYNSRFKSAMVNDNLLYVDWSAGKPNPKVLTMEDADRLRKSDKLFARKFSPSIDAGILDYLDELTAPNK